ncbi:MAG: hypothetical protein UX75_C0019G0002 [Candidatus Moranbacteria bacterium GW2011_GWE2_47_10]|nr:MAG: hypothetical protein UX75_C0019G0002 [Candidatus Moranbacteria bacterium GW2011_GWE2_47_10]
MNNLNDDPRGGTMCLSKAGLVIGDGAKTGPAIAAPNGAGIDFVIDGIAYHKADAATVLPLSADTVQAADTTCIYLMQVDSGGNVTSVKGVEVLNTRLVAGIGRLEWPTPDANKCPFGAVKVKTVAVTFTPGTTALDAAGVTETYYDIAMGVPLVGLTS